MGASFQGGLNLRLINTYKNKALTLLIGALFYCCNCNCAEIQTNGNSWKRSIFVLGSFVFFLHHNHANFAKIFFGNISESMEV